MAISVCLHARARSVTGVKAGPFRAFAHALEVIPRTLVQNAGGNVVRPHGAPSPRKTCESASAKIRSSSASGTFVSLLMMLRTSLTFPDYSFLLVPYIQNLQTRHRGFTCLIVCG